MPDKTLRQELQNLVRDFRGNVNRTIDELAFQIVMMEENLDNPGFSIEDLEFGRMTAIQRMVKLITNLDEETKSIEDELKKVFNNVKGRHSNTLGVSSNCSIVEDTSYQLLIQNQKEAEDNNNNNNIPPLETIDDYTTFSNLSGRKRKINNNDDNRFVKRMKIDHRCCLSFCPRECIVF